MNTKKTNLGRSIMITIFLLSVIGLNSCLKQKQNKGYISPDSDETTIDFTTNKGVINILANFDGVEKVFLFDTGDDLCSINRKELKGRVSKTKVSTGGKIKTGIEVINSMKIGNVDFQKICARNLNYSFLEKDIPNFGGTIGQSIISKANWMIDYPTRKMKVSAKEINSDGFITLNIPNLKDPKINFTYEGETYTAFIDLGSSTALTVVEGSKLGIRLKEKLTFENETREIASAAGYVTYPLKVGNMPSLSLGSVEFKNVNTVLRQTASTDIRIGMPFFKNNILYIDNINKRYKIK